MRQTIRLLLGTAVGIIVLAAAGVLVMRHYAQPRQVSRLLVSLVHDELGLELRFAGEPRYAFLPRLTLELDEAKLSAPGATPLLSAGRLNLALPWSSLRGDVLRVDRLELDTLRLDLDALSAWLADSKSGAIPAIALHVRIRGGVLHRGGEDFASGVGFDGDLDLAAIDAWLKKLNTTPSATNLLPPGAIAAEIATLRLHDATLHGLRVHVDNVTP